MPNASSPAATAPSAKTRVKRYHHLAKYDRQTIDAILDAGLVCHIGYVVDGQPFVTPANYWRIGDEVYWHGSSASRMLRAQAQGIPVCLTVTHLDGIVIARAAYNHNVNYRSVMAFGVARLCDEATKRHALQVFTDRLAPGLWDYARTPTELEWKTTAVLRMSLDEASAKIHSGPPVDDAADYARHAWAGVIPVGLVAAPAQADPRLRTDVPVPDFVRNFRLPR